MNCDAFRKMLVGDEPRDREQLEAHAADCADCAELLAEARELSDAVDAWKAESPAPPAVLEAKVLAAIEGEARGADVVSLAERRQRRAPRRIYAYAAAAAVIVALLALPWLWQGLSRTPLEEALHRAEASQRDYAEAIAGLEREAATVLQRAGDPSLPAEQAAVLLSYRDRLTHLDAVITEVRGFLEENPGHSGGHTVLLAAYREKDDVLRKVIELQPGGTS